MADTKETKRFIIPVEWTVYSTVVVEGVDSLQEAKNLVEDNMCDIPLSRNPDYVDDSYRIAAEDDDELEIAQDYHTCGVLMSKDDNGLIDYTVLD